MRRRRAFALHLALRQDADRLHATRFGPAPGLRAVGGVVAATDHDAAVRARGVGFADRIALGIDEVGDLAVAPDHAGAVAVQLVVPAERDAAVVADAVGARERARAVDRQARDAFGGAPAERDRMAGLVIGEADRDAVVGDAERRTEEAIELGAARIRSHHDRADDRGVAVGDGSDDHVVLVERRTRDRLRPCAHAVRIGEAVDHLDAFFRRPAPGRCAVEAGGEHAGRDAAIVRKAGHATVFEQGLETPRVGKPGQGRGDEGDSRCKQTHGCSGARRVGRHCRQDGGRTPFPQVSRSFRVRFHGAARRPPRSPGGTPRSGGTVRSPASRRALASERAQAWRSPSAACRRSCSRAQP